MWACVARFRQTAEASSFKKETQREGEEGGRLIEREVKGKWRGGGMEGGETENNCRQVPTVEHYKTQRNLKINGAKDKEGTKNSKGWLQKVN